MRISDWSSDVCSSDLLTEQGTPAFAVGARDRRRTARPRRVSSCNPPPPLGKRAKRRDRKSVVEGKSGSVRGDLGGGRLIKKQTKEWCSRQRACYDRLRT